MNKIAIIGYGRFGQLLAQMSGNNFEVFIMDTEEDRLKQAQADGYRILPTESIADVDYIFLAVPIAALEAVLKKISPLIKSNQTVIDICSVKVYPVELMKKYITKAQILATHPLFGPDSAKHGLGGLLVAVCPIRISQQDLKLINSLWEDKGASVIGTTPEAHDKDTVYSQAFTYSVAKVISKMELPSLIFTTRSFSAIKKVADYSANDSEQLFHDMLFYNPYFKTMKKELEQSWQIVKTSLDKIEIEQSQTTA